MDTVSAQAPKPKTTYANNAEAAHEVQDYMRVLPSPPRGSRYSLRPYNRFSPEFTDWWLIPSREWPAYPRSKLFFHRLEADLYTGFYVEKGIGERVAGVLGVKKAHAMSRDWYSHEFLRRAKTGEIGSTAQAVRLSSGLPVVLHVDAYAANEAPEPDTEQEREPDEIEFEIQSGNGHLRLLKRRGGALIPVDGCTSLIELAQVLEASADLDYFWLDLFIGVRLQYGTHADGSWSAAEIWERALGRWAPWVK